MKGITVTGKNSLRLNSKMVDKALLYYAKEKILNSDYKHVKDSRWYISMCLNGTIRHKNGDVTLNFTDQIKIRSVKK